MGKKKRVQVTRGNWWCKMPEDRTDMWGYNFYVFQRKYPMKTESEVLMQAGLGILNKMQRNEFVAFATKYDSYLLQIKKFKTPIKNVVDFVQFCKQWREIKLVGEIDTKFSTAPLYCKPPKKIKKPKQRPLKVMDDYDYTMLFRAYVKPYRKELGMHILKKTIKSEGDFINFGKTFENYCAYVRKNNLAFEKVLYWDDFCAKWYKLEMIAGA